VLTLRPYQQAAIDSLYAYFGEHSGHPLVVIPTAGGKSLVMAAFIKGVLEAWPDQRILVVTHVRELIAQNFAELVGLWPLAPAGIYSAGLGRRDITARILFAGIQSIHKRAYAVQQCDLVLIDEAHLIPATADTMYRRFLDTLARLNPQLKVIGFTATPYRLDSGMLHQGRNALFTDIAFEVSVRQLIDDGYLCPLVSKAAETRLEVEGVGLRGGEFIARQLQAAVDLPAITDAAIDEVASLGRDRRSWLVFCSGIEHAGHVADAIRARGFTAATIFGDTAKVERDRTIAAFKRGELRALVSMGVLTTGFNAPNVDLIAMLRPTNSTGLYVQMAGRGTRLAPGKTDCLVLDFAGNVARHGPIDAVQPRRPGDGQGEAPVKVCPHCRSIVATAVRVCPDCGHAFPPPAAKVAASASTLAILSSGKPQWLAVDDIAYRRHDKADGRPSLRVEYRCGLVRHREWVCFEHSGYPRQKAVTWWLRRTADLAVPMTVAEALRHVDRLAKPSAIAVRPSGRFSEITSHRFAACSEPFPVSAPSATASPAASAGSTPACPSPTGAATVGGMPSAAAAARTSAMGDAA
jgi:DNA repair protein RadD